MSTSKYEAIEQELYDVILAVWDNNKATIFSSGWDWEFIEILLRAVGKVIEAIAKK